MKKIRRRFVLSFST